LTAGTRITVKLAPDVPGLEALGARDASELFGDPPSIVTGDRAERVGSALRLPLPGTPDATGRQREKPRGAGTGLLYLRRYRPGGLEGWRARFTHPRSTSLAARHWNLICHLQAHGLAAPQLVALAERGGGVAGAESLVITRELEGFVPLAEWLAAERDRGARRRGLKSLALALQQLFRCGAWLPRTSATNLRIQARDSDDCAALQITNLRTEQQLLAGLDVVRARLPAVAFTSFASGRILSEVPLEKRFELLAKLSRECGERLSIRERCEVLVRLFESRDDALQAAWRCSDAR
jgi:hypothetical protein